MVEDIDKGSKGSDGLENEYDGIQNLETTGSDTVGDNSSVHQDDTLTLRFIEKKYCGSGRRKTLFGVLGYRCWTFIW